MLDGLPIAQMVWPLWPVTMRHNISVLILNWYKLKCFVGCHFSNPKDSFCVPGHSLWKGRSKVKTLFTNLQINQCFLISFFPTNQRGEFWPSCINTAITKIFFQKGNVKKIKFCTLGYIMSNPFTWQNNAHFTNIVSVFGVISPPVTNDIPCYFKKKN